MPDTVVVTWSFTDGAVVSPASSQSALAPNVNGVDAQKPRPAERAAVNDHVPWYGWPNWFTQNWSSSSTHALRRFRPTEAAEMSAQGASPTDRFHSIITRFVASVSATGSASPPGRNRPPAGAGRVSASGEGRSGSVGPRGAS